MNHKTVTCRVCDQEFQHVVRAGTQPKYCSEQCARRAAWEKRKQRRESVTEQRCPRCDEVKPLTEFSSMTQAYCRPCQAAYARVQRANQSPEQKARALLQDTAWRNGVTVEHLTALLDQQNRLCAICRRNLDGDARRWHVDHDHTCCDPGGRKGMTRKKRCGNCVRGILCANCNVGIGMFNDDPAALRGAADYLERVTPPVIAATGLHAW